MQKLLIRLIIGGLFSLFALFGYYTNTSQNPVTGEKQHVQLSQRQEVAIGLQSRQQVAQQYGGLLPNQTLQAYVDRVGGQVVARSGASQSGYPFEFHLLRDPQTINAFALPGGQVFITAALLARLNSEAQLAGVLGHEVGHVVGRHGAEHLAKQQLGAALVNSVGIAASDGADGGRSAAMIAQAANQLVSLRYGREDELESDRFGFKFMTEAGYSPKGIVEVMKILQSASGGGRKSEFLSTHPDPGNRFERLQAMVQQTYPNGIPANLKEGKEEFSRVVRSQQSQR
ncbi:M48 family metalloprotease [Oscillatoria sp. FACHB-1406]|uniref:M48 family metalloprotease n=1 Tax=Oscillatoria sp. FACHB-1406 TaxID=2692846 RepID=UPI001683FFE5|nr:M48 family metalloprotease [Oscillatoria sp. FACHB-1406]